MSSAYFVFTFIVQMLHRHLLGGSNDFNVVVGSVVNAMLGNDFAARIELSPINEAECFGRAGWEMLFKFYQEMHVAVAVQGGGQ